jgi:hypothetical protein
MKIHALCLIKNEADVIEQTLRAAAEWCDWIYVLDNGSSDGTWEVVRELSRELEAVIPFKRDLKPYSQSIRAEILRHFAHRAQVDDWWCILDADEFYIDAPRTFLRDVPVEYRAVWVELYNYLFTDRDLEAYRRDPKLYDHSVPVEQKLRYYTIAEYSDVRFFRHSRLPEQLIPELLHPIYPRRIRMKHFMYRSPEQIRGRLETRAEAMQRGSFVHEKRANWTAGDVAAPGPVEPADLTQSWQGRVVDHSTCYYDALDGAFEEPSAWTPPTRPPLRVRVRLRARTLVRELRLARHRSHKRE